jgi:hypothetical protein
MRIYAYLCEFIKGVAIMKSKSMLVSLAVLFVVAVSGCHRVAQDTTTFNRYNNTTLKVSTSSDVLAMIEEKGETLTLSENAVASSGETKKGNVIWFNAVAFDDETSKASRKYAFVTNPKAGRGLGRSKAQTLRFDAELVVNVDVLNEPFASDNTKKIAVLESTLSDFSDDFIPLVKNSNVLNSGSLMVKQLLKGLISHLKSSPGNATELSSPSGLNFDHMNLNKTNAKMSIVGGIVNLKVKTGSTTKKYRR